MLTQQQQDPPKLSREEVQELLAYEAPPKPVEKLIPNNTRFTRWRKQWVPALILLALAYISIFSYQVFMEQFFPAPEITVLPDEALMTFLETYYGGDFEGARDLVCNNYDDNLDTSIQTFRDKIIADGFTEDTFFNTFDYDFSLIRAEVDYLSDTLAWVNLMGIYYINNVADNTRDFHLIDEIFVNPRSNARAQARVSMRVENNRWTMC